MKKPDIVVFKKYLMSLSIEELMPFLDEYEKVKQVQVKDKINKMKQRELQTRVESFNPPKNCPTCGSEKFVKNGFHNNLQRYLCSNCKSTFSVVTNTFMEGTTWTWEVWVKLLQMTMNSYSLDEIVDTLEQDYHLEGINRKSVFLARHKLIHALSLMPKPTLSGVIQVDETFFRENQKGTRTDWGKVLINVIPSVLPKRLPRRGYQPSRLGVMGPEYACVVCAVDNNEHAYSVVISMGKVDPKLFVDCFDEHFKDVTYLCTDGSPIYNEYCDLRSIPHYVRPSSFVKTLTDSGYKLGLRPTDIESDSALAEVYENNHKLANQLYYEGLLDYIDSARYMDFANFCKIKKQYGLNLSRVNAFHNYLKLHLEKETTGVATKYLPMYVDAYTFMYNWRHAHKTTLSSMKDAEIVLSELIKDKNVFTLNDLKKKDFFIAPKPTNRYMKLLTEQTRRMRIETDNKFLKFDEEDRVISFDHRKYIKETPVGKLRPIGKEYNIKRYSRMTHWQLYCAIMELPKSDIGKIVCKLIANDKRHKIYEEDVKYMTAHELTQNDLSYKRGGDLVDLDRLFILKHKDNNDVPTQEDDADVDYDDFPF